jgi:hypothetical protein
MGQFITRLFISIIQFLVIAKANLILDTFENTILFLGLRSFLIFSPFITFVFGIWNLFSALIISTCGMIFLTFGYKLMGVIGISAGISIANFLLRSDASSNISGAANYRIIFHCGSIVSGFLFILLSNDIFFWLTNFLFIITCLFYSRPHGKILFHSLTYSSKRRISFKIELDRTYIIKYTSWFLLGISLGIQSYSVCIILPQYLIKYYINLPQWFGLVIAIYSLCSALCLLTHTFDKKQFQLKLCYIWFALNTFIIGIPQMFHVETFQGSIIWVITLSITNGLFTPTMDSAAMRDKSLLVKELSVGIGAAITVVIMRTIYNPTVISSIALITLSIGYYLKFTLPSESVLVEKTNK